MLMIAALAAAASASPASPYSANVAGWMVTERPSGCAMGTEFAGSGKTYLALQKSVDGAVILLITNEAWSARDGQPYKVSYRLNGKEYFDGTTIGYRSGDARGFWSSVGAGFERDFAAGKDLSVYLDGTFIRKLSLAGTGAALAALNRCVAGLRGRAQAEARENAAAVPHDPFAKAPAAASDKGTPKGKSRP